MTKLLVGLGNPEKKYKNNRHNVGKIFINYLINKLSNLKIWDLKEKNKLLAKIFKNKNLILVKTESYMNISGIVIKKIIRNLKLEIINLIIIHDDLDIPLGKFKIQFAQGPKLHNGIKSIEDTLKTKDFWRIRIGIDNRKKENWIKGEKYVLQNFLPEEKELLEKNVFPKILSNLKLNQLNPRKK